MCDIMLLWNGAENKTAPFLLLEWETSSHYIAILGVRLILQQSTSCVLLFGGVFPRMLPF